MEKSDIVGLIDARLPDIAENDPKCDGFGRLALKPASELLVWSLTHRHKHFYKEMLFVISGECPLFVGENFFHCSAGTLFLINPGELHNSVYPAGSSGVHLWMSLHDDMLMCGFYRLTADRHETGYSVPWSIELTDRALLNRLNDLLKRRARGEDGAETALASLFRMVFCELYRLYDPETDNRNNTMASIGRFIRSTCGRGVNINHLARMAGYSRQHFMRKYKEVNGCTVGETVRDSRLALLETMPGGTPVKEAAELMGFDSPQAYCHWRRKIRSGAGGRLNDSRRKTAPRFPAGNS